MKDSPLSPAAKTIFWATFVAGTLDILTALTLYGFVFSRVGAQRILQSIASTLLGKAAFQGGVGASLLGLGIHYCIALTFVTLYFFSYPLFPFLKKNRVVSGLLFGLFVWMVMNMAVLPLIGYARFPSHWDSILKGALILLFAIGLPTSFLISRYYAKPTLSPHAIH